MSTLTGRDRTALLVVDVQNDVVGNAWHRDEVVGRIAHLVESARTADVPVVWVQHNADDMPIGSDGWNLVDSLHPAPDEHHIDKQYGDSFAATDLESVFDKFNVKHVVLCGAQTDACITATLYGAIHRGYDVTLVEDAHTTDDTEFAGYSMPAGLLVGHLVRAAKYSAMPGIALTAAPTEAITW